jgi:hypothetical protein
MRRLARAGFCGLIFIAALAGASWGLGRFLPFPDVPTVSAKLAHLDAHGDGYDTIFLGSSRIYFQVLPEIYDAATARAGVPTRSFNAGVAGLSPPEESFILEEILRRPHGRLRWVFLEIGFLRADPDAQNLQTARAVYWHDWVRWRLLCRRALDFKRRSFFSAKGFAAWQEALGQIATHTRLTVQRAVHLGRGASQLEPRWLRKKSAPAADDLRTLGPRRDGWTRAILPEQMAGADLERYQRRMAEMRVKPIRPMRGNDATQECLARMVAAVIAAGARPVLLVPPITGDYVEPDPAIASQVRVLNFADPAAYPALFDPAMRYDTTHVNAAGSKLFTEALAQHFVELAR